MAPLCSDPRQIVITFNPARRRALLSLVDEVTLQMLKELEEIEPSSDPKPTDSTIPNEGQRQHRNRADAVAGAGSKTKDDETTVEEAVKLPEISHKEATSIQKAAKKHVLAWKKEFMPKLEEIVNAEDDDKIRNERKKRTEDLEKKATNEREDEVDLMSFDDAKTDKSDDLSSLQRLYKPTSTRLTTVPLHDRKEAVSCILLLLLSTGKYSAHSRTLALYLASSLELSQSFVIDEEIEIAKTLMESSKADEKQREATMNAEKEASQRREQNKFGRFWKVGLASVAGATLIGVTGGLAAPLVAGAIGGVMGGIGLGGVASFLGIFWMNGALVGALFGAYGAKMTVSLRNHDSKRGPQGRRKLCPNI